MSVNNTYTSRGESGDPRAILGQGNHTYSIYNQRDVEMQLRQKMEEELAVRTLRRQKAKRNQVLSSTHLMDQRTDSATPPGVSHSTAQIGAVVYPFRFQANQWSNGVRNAVNDNQEQRINTHFTTTSSPSAAPLSTAQSAPLLTTYNVQSPAYRNVSLALLHNVTQVSGFHGNTSFTLPLTLYQNSTIISSGNFAAASIPPPFSAANVVTRKVPRQLGKSGSVAAKRNPLKQVVGAACRNVDDKTATAGCKSVEMKVEEKKCENESREIPTKGFVDVERIVLPALTWLDFKFDRKAIIDSCFDYEVEID